MADPPDRAAADGFSEAHIQPSTLLGIKHFKLAADAQKARGTDKKFTRSAFFALQEVPIIGPRRVLLLFF